MNVIIIKVNFEKRTLQKERVILLTTGDYNSTKLVFQFDKDYEEKKVFELAKPGTSEAIFVKEIVDNEIVLVGYDAEGNEASIFSEAGKYPFEISLYGENSKLTSLSSTLTVKEGKVEVDNKVVECYIPIFDDLMNEATSIINNLKTVEEEVQSAEATRVENEKNRISAEKERVKNEGERAEAEESRNSAETERVKAEKARSQNEETRQSNEEDRITNETTRGDAETARSEAEKERNENETTRTQNEEKRVTAETNRGKAEETRGISEKAREEAEKNRVTAETKRAEDEKSRADAEKSRAETETKRVEEEKKRDTAEKTRSENETTRQTNETTRVEAEAIRNSNESTRIANEIIRQEKFRMIDNVLKSITVEGSNIHVEDSADWFAKIGVCGKSEQETREGYNKANYNTSSTEYNFDVGDVKAGVDYTLAFKTSGNITTNIRYKELKENLKTALIVNNTSYVMNFQAAYDEILNFNIYSASTGFSVTEIMLLEGTYTADTLPAFEEYGAMPSFEFPSEIKSVTGDIEVEFCNKNLLNPVGASRTSGGITFTNNGDGTFTVKGTNTQALSFPLTDLSEYPIYLEKGKTYTQLFILVSGTNGSSRVVPSVIDDDGKITYNYFTNNQTKTVDKNYKINAYNFYMETLETVDFTFKVQLEEGPATDYTPHQSQIYPLYLNKELNGDETVRDRIVRKEGKWCYEFNWWKHIITGEEYVNYQSAPDENGANSNKTAYFGITLEKDGQTSAYAKNNVFSNYFNNLFTPSELWQTNLYADADTEAISMEARLRLRILKTRLTGFTNELSNTEKADLLKIYLKNLHDNGNPIYIVYKLAEPIYEEITDETLIAQLDAIEEKAKTYKTVTNILSDAHLEVIYKKDLQTQLNEVLSLTLESGV